MSNQTPMWDQADFEAFLVQLKSDTERHEAALRAAGKEVPARPADTADVIANTENFEMHNARLRGLLRTGVKPAAKETQAAKQTASTIPATAPQSYDARIEKHLAASREKRQAQKNLAVELLEKVRDGALSLTQACEMARAKNK